MSLQQMAFTMTVLSVIQDVICSILYNLQDESDSFCLDLFSQ